MRSFKLALLVSFSITCLVFALIVYELRAKAGSRRTRGGKPLKGPDEYTEDQKAAIKSRIERMERLVPWLRAQQQDFQIRADLLAHEADRISEELVVTRMMLDLDHMPEMISEVTEKLTGIIGKVAQQSSEPTIGEGNRG